MHPIKKKEYLIDKLLKMSPDERQYIIQKTIKIKTSQSAIDKRIEYFKYRTILIPYYYMLIGELNNLEEQGYIRYVIRGSSAWFMNMLKVMKINRKQINNEDIMELFNKIEKREFYKNSNGFVSLLAQNWDISVYVDNKNLDDVYKKLFYIFKNIQNEMTKNLINTRTVGNNKNLKKIK